MGYPAPCVLYREFVRWRKQLYRTTHPERVTHMIPMYSQTNGPPASRYMTTALAMTRPWLSMRYLLRMPAATASPKRS